MLQNLFFGTNEPKGQYAEREIEVLRLIRSENIGCRTFYSLLKFCGSPKLALERAAELSLKGGKARPIKIYSKSEAEAELRELDKIGAKFITFESVGYSNLLSHIPDPPPVLTYLGDIKLMNSRCLAIVGSRNASVNGRSFAAKIARDVSNSGYTIVSGLARGIDTAAHQANPAATIAVIAGGIDHIYPPENAELYKKIAQAGLIIAEAKIGDKPLAQHFPQRNRLISGLSLGTVVVEASLKSGSLITARFALEQNREIFAVPGFPMDPRCQGTNKLLKEGAHLLESTDDIFSNLPSNDIAKKVFAENTKDGNSYKHLSIDYLNTVTDRMRRQVIDMLSSVPTSLESVIQGAELPPPVVHLIVLELELAGKVHRTTGNKISLIY